MFSYVLIIISFDYYLIVIKLNINLFLFFDLFITDSLNPSVTIKQHMIKQQYD